jgi:polysaccharide biosynthesis/export protein
MTRRADREGVRRWASSVALALAVLTGVAAPRPLAAQQTGSPPAGDTARAMPRAMPLSSAPGGRVLLDSPIDRAQYRLGPGDALELTIFGEIARHVELTVSPEGSVVIPTIGVIRVLDLNVDEAEAQVARAVYRFHRNVDVHLTLAGVRQFRVYVVGDPQLNGTQIAAATTRVSELFPELERNGPVRRNVLVRRANGDSIAVDLARFRQTGDLRANPTLREGDVVVVPAAGEIVQVVGRVAYPGEYEYVPGETLAELLEIANGGRPFPADAADSIRVARVLEAGRREVLTLPRHGLAAAPAGALVLRPFDAVYVPAIVDMGRQPVVHITGQVARPGTYPIRPDSTTLRALIELAGGLAPDASLVGASLHRDTVELRNQALERLGQVPIELLSPEELRLMRIHGQADAQAVAVDFDLLLNGGADVMDMPLQMGDRVNIPRRGADVLVLGSVGHPGRVPYGVARTAHEYVDVAGGFTRRSDRRGAVVLKARTGARVELREAGVLEAGDAVIVPFRDRRSLGEYLQTASTIAAVTSSLVLTYLAIFR